MIRLYNLKIHPELCDLIPSLSEEEYTLLENSLIDEGCRDSIMAGISHGTLDKVELVDKLAPEIIKKRMENGDITINSAYEYTRALETMPKAKQEEVTEQLEAAADAKEARNIINLAQVKEEQRDRYFVYLDECRDLLKRYDKAISEIAQLPATLDDFRKMREIILEETYESQLRGVDQGMAKLSKIRQFLKEGKFKKWDEI